jgi:hypothetical protein
VATLGYSNANFMRDASPLDIYSQSAADRKRLSERKGAYSTFVTRGQRSSGQSVLGYYGQDANYIPPEQTYEQQFGEYPILKNVDAFSGLAGGFKSASGGFTQVYGSGAFRGDAGDYRFIYDDNFAAFIERQQAKQPSEFRLDPYTGDKSQRYFSGLSMNKMRDEGYYATSLDYSAYLDRVIATLFPAGYGDAFNTYNVSRGQKQDNIGYVSLSNYMG